MRTALAALAGALVGALATWMLTDHGSRASVSVSLPVNAVSTPVPTPGPAPGAAAVTAESPRPPPVVRPAIAPVPPSAPDASVETVRAENARLREQLETVTRKLAEEQRAQVAEHGKPIPAPENLPPRFDGEALRAAMTNALAEAGFKNAQVTSVDCTEFPCILYGDGMGDREDFEKLDKAEALQPYGEDAHRAMGWGSKKGPDGQESYQFGLALYPKGDDDAARAELNKRIQYRVQQMRESGN